MIFSKRIVGLKLSIILLGMIALMPCYSQVSITMEKRDGLFYLPGKVNGLPLKFIFDTGATRCLLSSTEAYFMLKNGYLKAEDISGTSYTRIASGEVIENVDVVLRELEIAGIKLHNVSASIVQKLDAPLLLGQSAIQKLGSIQLEGNKLTIMQAQGMPSASEKMALQTYEKGRLLMDSEDYEEALKVLNKALTYTQQDKLRAKIYESIAYSYSSMSDDMGKTIEALNKALEADPSLGVATYNLGVAYYETNNLNNSLKAFKQAITLCPKNNDLLSSSYYYLGDLYLKMQLFEDAKKSFLKSISISPNPFAYFGLATLYEHFNQYKDAADCYQKGIEFEPNRLNNVPHYHSLGLALLYSGDSNNAFKAFVKATEVFYAHSEVMAKIWDSADPRMDKIKKEAETWLWSEVDSELWMARIASKPEERIRIYTQRIFINKLTQRGITALDYYTLAGAYFNIGDRSEALETVNRGLGTFKENPELMFQKALLLDKDYDAQITLLKKILTKEHEYKSPYFDYGTVYNNIAWAYRSKGQYEIGLPYAIKAVKLNPEHDYIWETLGELYFFLGQYEECVNAMTQCLNCQGTTQHKSAYEFRSKAFKKLGNHEASKADLDKASKLYESESKTMMTDPLL